MKKKYDPNNIPFQVKELILEMKDPKNDGYITSNYRLRLQDIIVACQEALDE